MVRNYKGFFLFNLPPSVRSLLFLVRPSSSFCSSCLINIPKCTYMLFNELRKGNEEVGRWWAVDEDDVQIVDETTREWWTKTARRRDEAAQETAIRTPMKMIQQGPRRHRWMKQCLEGRHEMWNTRHWTTARNETRPGTNDEKWDKAWNNAAERSFLAYLLPSLFAFLSHISAPFAIFPFTRSSFISFLLFLPFSPFTFPPCYFSLRVFLLSHTHYLPLYIQPFKWRRSRPYAARMTAAPVKYFMTASWSVGKPSGTNSTINNKYQRKNRHGKQGRW